jgi:hypothetical protein
MDDCQHLPNQITMFRGGGQLSKTGELIRDENKVFICDCGKSWDYDPNDEPEENIKKELSNELYGGLK